MNARTLVLIAALALAALVAGCGSSHDGHGGDAGGAGNATDAAFVNDMVPHHESAVEMAEIAKEEADHQEIRKLSDEIIAAQKREIETMNSVKDELGEAHGDHMGGDEHMRGMDMDPEKLRGAKPFDRAFIDMMVPHHEGAVRMAREELATGENPKLRRLAEEIIAAQRREIDQMRQWRKRWYGSATDGSGQAPGY